VLVRSVRAVLWVTLAAAVAAFCIVQDRVTAAGARRYVTLQTAALAGRDAGRGPAVTVEEVMRPAIRRSVRLGLLAGGGVASVGLIAAAVMRRAARRAELGSGPVS
jgi:hypothetical protein